MNALQPILAPPLDPITCLAPASDTPDMLRLRGKLSIARDVASAEIGRWRDHSLAAHELYGRVIQTACQSIYAPVSVDHLEIAVQLCRRLLLCASQTDFLEMEVA